MDKIIADPVQK